MLAEPRWNPPELTFEVLWQPAPLQSRLPIGMWLLGLVVIVTFAKVPATLAPWQLRQFVTPWWVPTTEYTA
jgi:hypothetical protein